MQTEVFDEREMEPETLDREPDDEAVALIKELGLSRQLTVTGKRMAYPIPTAEQGFVIRVLFPAATLVEGYDAGIIPLRVLKEIRSYKAEHPDHLLVVRHAAPSQVRDPVLLSYHGEHKWRATGSDVTEDMRMIARWGDALESWATLLEKAVDLNTARCKEALIDIVAKCEGRLAALAKGSKHRNPELPYFDPRNGGNF